MRVSVILRKSKSQKQGATGRVYFRIFENKEADFRVASSITINPDYWDAAVPGYAAKTPMTIVTAEEQKETNELIKTILHMIKKSYKKGMDAKWLANVLDECTLKMSETKPDKAPLPADEGSSEGLGLIDYFKMYLERAEFNDWHREAQTSVMHRLQRYEKWLGYNNGNPNYRLLLQDFDKEQVEDYADYMEHEHEYRDANRKFFAQFNIKKILQMAGIDRRVMTLNPLTRQAEQRPLYEVAASHLARRTFIGNLYKQVKDPALIASLTGHTETSVSFTRYRTIDDDIKRDVLKMIE